MPSNPDFIDRNYELLDKTVMRMPSNKNEAVLVVDRYNRLNSGIMRELGLSAESDSNAVGFGAVLGREFMVVMNNDYYYPGGDGTFYYRADETVYNKPDNVRVGITGILRIKEGANSAILSQGLIYHHELREYFTGKNRDSGILRAQVNEAVRAALISEPIKNVRTGKAFSVSPGSQEEIMYFLAAYQNLGGALSDPFFKIAAAVGGIIIPDGVDAGLPTDIYIYPKDFDGKEKVKAYVEEYNALQTEEAFKITCTDLMDVISGTMKTMISTISVALTGFAGISLVVSSIMIAIITYVSVIERTKEIGILRSVGARKLDISGVFLAETSIIGFVAGMIGVTLAWILTFPINAVISGILERQNTGVSIKNLAGLSPLVALAMVGLSILLTLIAGLIPSRIAARKDPVAALRSE